MIIKYIPNDILSKIPDYFGPAFCGELASVFSLDIFKTNDINADIERIDIPKISPLTMTFRNTKTGEIRLVEFGDHEGFDECMGNKDMQLIFG